jgi:hypothetical protein
MRPFIYAMTATLVLTVASVGLALDKKEVAGQWSLDEAKSASAPDGNTAGLMKDVNIKTDGTFEALYGTHGVWKIQGGKMLVTYQGSGAFRKDEPASMAGEFLKFPSPAMSGKFCYLKRK